ncbi:MAG: hypothetical protein R3E50_01805 [Halioglobus sp.]
MDADSDRLLLIQFARAPRAGQVKTRMLPVLTPSRACELHCELTLWTCRQLLASGLGAVELSVAGDAQHPLFSQCLALGVSRLTQQTGADLGARMYAALRTGLVQHAAVIPGGQRLSGDRRALPAASGAGPAGVASGAGPGQRRRLRADRGPYHHAGGLSRYPVGQ